MLSRDEGAPVSSGVIGDELQGNDPARQLIQLIRRGQSFSGRERNCVFLNTQGKRFANVSYVSGLGFADDARAIGQVDWDQDGDLDLWISNRNAPQVRFLRNRIPNDCRWIALRLQGRESNRDAIGARVVVTLPDAPTMPIVRTVRAGDGYLSQSTKWVHVGVGDAANCSVRIHWPSGSSSLYAKLATNQRYRCVEGAANAVTAEASRPPITLDAKPVELPASDDVLSVFSLVRPSVPNLEYLDNQGTMRNLSDDRGKPLLLLLWATWCGPCLQELSELSRHQELLQQADVKVLALCVDRLSSDAQADPDRAADILSRIKFPFESGEATDPLVDKLQMVNNYLFGLEKPFPVPTSFLINENHRLAGIYRGRIDLERLEQDLAHLHDSPMQRRTRSVPFSGPWAGPMDTLPMAALVLELINRGYLEDASELVQRIQGVFDKATLLDLIVRLGLAHYKTERLDRAELHFRMARKLQPNTVGPEIELGQWHESRGEFEQARRYYAAAVKKSPQSLPAINNLAWLLSTCSDKGIRNGEQAVELATEAARMTNRQHPGVLDTWAASLAEAGRFEEAVQVADQAIRIATQSSRVNLAAEIKRRRARYASQQSP